MRIYISNYGSTPKGYAYTLEKHGVVYCGQLRFKVIDKHLFVLAVIRYGIEFEEVM